MNKAVGLLSVAGLGAGMAQVWRRYNVMTVIAEWKSGYAQSSPGPVYLRNAQMRLWFVRPAQVEDR